MQPVFQDPSAALNPRMKVLEIVTEPLVIHGGKSEAGQPAIDTRSEGIMVTKPSPTVRE